MKIEKITLSSGDIYEGEVIEGKANGRGVENYTNGDKYEGYFKNGERNGHGKYIYVTGDIYEGNYKEGDSNGQGSYKWKQGLIYKGEFQKGKMHGLGEMTKSKWFSLIGKWENNETINGKFKAKIKSNIFSKLKIITKIKLRNNKIPYFYKLKIWVIAAPLLKEFWFLFLFFILLTACLTIFMRLS